MSDLPQLPPRPPDGHKGTFGTVCVLGGQTSTTSGRIMVGGPALSALAALRCGSGLGVLALPHPIINAALTIAPSAMGLALPVDESGSLLPSETATTLDQYINSFSTLAIGPGWGVGSAQQQILSRLITLEHPPMVIDADALNALAGITDVQRDLRANVVLTPHPGEFQRLAQSLNIHNDPIDPNTRYSAAEELAQQLGCVVVLKGSHTVVSNGIETWVNNSGNVALATAGTGDVLTGVIASLIGQFFKPSSGNLVQTADPTVQNGLNLFDCARLGVWLHGRAADRWAAAHGHAGLLAADLLEHLPDVIQEYRTSQR